MEKQWIAILLLIAVLLTVTGCSAADTVRRLDAAEDRLEAKLDYAQAQLERRIRNTGRPAQLPPAGHNPEPMLTKEQAQQIALDYLGFTADQVSRLRAEYDPDDGIPRFDVELHQGDWEYELEIHGESGQVLSCDRDHKYD